MLSELLIIALLVAANGIFAGAEIALVALRRTRLQELVEVGDRRAAAAIRLKSHPEQLLATVQVGITVLGATAAALGGASLAEDLTPLLARLELVAAYAHEIAMTLVVSAISFFTIVVGELVPKSLGLRSAERYGLLVARPLLTLAYLARPVITLLTKTSNLLLRPFGDRTTFGETRYSSEEIQQLVEQARKEGDVDPNAAEIVSRALELPDLTVGDVMVPRRDIVMLDRNATASELRRVLLATSFSRMPVYEDDFDNVIGCVNVRDLATQAFQGKPLSIAEAMRAAHFVPASRQALAQLSEMRQERTPMAFVVDGHGGLAGLVTLEDLLEELVGDIVSEHAREAPMLVRREDDGSLVVLGSAKVRELNREHGLELPDDGDWNTIAGLCIAHAGGIPARGSHLELPDGSRLEIVDASPHRIRSVRILPGSEGAATASPARSSDTERHAH